MNPKKTLLALFLASMQSPDTRAQIMDEVGSPNNATRFAHNRDEDGALIVVTDTVNGPQRDGAMETISAAILVDDKAVLATMQVAPDNVGEISTDEYNAIAQGFATYLADDADIQLSAKGDPELDGDTKVMFFAKATEDGPYTATDVSDKLTDYIVDGDMSFIYADGKGALIATAQLLENLGTVGQQITHGATKIIAIGRGKKLARGPKIDVGGEKVSTWAYVREAANGGMEMVVLDKDTLAELQTKPFDGKYATADRKGDEVIVVLHVLLDADVADEPEQRLDDAADTDDANADKGDGGMDTKADDAEKPDEKFALNRFSADEFFAAAA